MARNIPDWGWVVIFLIPPDPDQPRGRPLRRRAAARPVVHDRAQGCGRAARPVVRGLVPDPDQRSRAGLAAAVRAAGADAETASRVAAVRERLLARRYGPPGQPGRRPGSGTRRWRSWCAAWAIRCAGGGGRVAAGCPAARALRCRHVRAGRHRRPRACIEAGALRAAAEGFSPTGRAGACGRSALV